MRDSSKDLAWKQDPYPLEQQRSATIPPWEQKGQGKLIFWEKSEHTHESKKGTEYDKVWWHRSPPPQIKLYMFVLLLNKRIWDFPSKSAASAGATNSLCLPYT